MAKKILIILLFAVPLMVVSLIVAPFFLMHLIFLLIKQIVQRLIIMIKSKAIIIFQFIEKNKLYLLAILLLISFHSFFEAFFKHLLVDKAAKIPAFLTSFDNNIVTKSLFSCVIVYALIKGRLRVSKNEKIEPKTILTSLTLGFFYTYLRISYGDVSFAVLFSIFSFSIYYFDLLMLPLVGNLIISGLNKPKKKALPIDPSEGFLLEVPIKDEKDDLLNRKNISPQMVERIYHSANPTTSFAVGIVSQWGNGKTSFLNLMCKELEEKGVIFFHFKPWVYEDKRSITYAFFSGLSQALHPYNKSLSRHLRLYSSMLSAVGTPFTRFCSALLMQGNDFDAQHTKIRNAIKNIGKPVIITIDDFDRLDEKEIAEVLKLIRNTASFPKTIYIAAYDREYIAKALEKINSYNSPQYLEKIFQLEFDLPAYDKQPMLNRMYKELKPILTTEDQGILKKEFDFEENLLNNRRDAIRLVNQFSIAYKFLKGEIYFMDLLSIEYIHLKYPLVYDALLKDRERILNQEPDKKPGYYLFEGSSLSEKLAKLTEKSTLGKEYAEKLLKDLFKKPETDQYEKRISSIYYIHRYFCYTLLDGDISEVDFRAAWSGNKETIKNVVSIYKNKNIWKLIKRIEDKYKSGLKSSEEYKKLFDFLFLIYENQNYSSGKSWVEGIFTKAIDDYNKTNEKSKTKLCSIINEHKDSELTLELFNCVKNEFNILRIFTKRYENTLLLKLEECLKTQFEKNPSMEKVGELMTYALKTNYENSPAMKFLRNEATKRLFINYIEKNSDQLEMLLPYFIYSDDTNGSLLWNPAISIWEKEGKNKEEDRTEKYNEFKQFIDKITKEKDTPALNEFKEFIQQCIGYKNKGSIFHFKYLKPYYPKENS